MSRLFNLLDKVNNRPDARDVHPALKQAVLAARAQGAIRHRKFAFVAAPLFFILLGGAVLYSLEDVGPLPQTTATEKQKSLPAVRIETPAQSRISSTTVKPPLQAVAQAMPAAKPAVAPAKIVQSPKVMKAPNPSLVVVRQATPASQANSTTRLHQEEAKTQPKDASLRDAYLLTARDLENKKEFGQALKYCKQALELAPDNYRLLNNIAGLSLRAGQPTEAVAAATEALKLKRDFLPALVNLGIAQARMGSDQQAMVSFVRAYTIDSANRSALYNIALLQEHAGRLDESALFFRRLADVGDPQGLTGMVRVFEKQHNVDEAVKVYREMVSSAMVSPQQKRSAEERLMQLQR